MDLPLETLEDAQLGPWRLSVEVDRSGHRPFPVTVEAHQGDRTEVLLSGQTNPGTSWRHPWLEVRYARTALEGPQAGDPTDADRLEERLFAELLPRALVPGSYVMLSCDGHRDSLRALTVDVPPPATRLGQLLWMAGARWYKVWYYPEGWREGHEKLQGNLPMDEAHRARAEAERRRELETFLESDLAEAFPACRRRARNLLDMKSG